MERKKGKRDAQAFARRFGWMNRIYGLQAIKTLITGIFHRVLSFWYLIFDFRLWYVRWGDRTGQDRIELGQVVVSVIIICGSLWDGNQVAGIAISQSINQLNQNLTSAYPVLWVIFLGATGNDMWTCEMYYIVLSRIYVCVCNIYRITLNDSTKRPLNLSA